MKKPIYEENQRETKEKEVAAIKLVLEVGAKIAELYPEIQNLYRDGITCEQIALNYNISNQYNLTDEIARNAVNHAIRILISSEEREEIFQRFSRIHGVKGGERSLELGVGIHNMSDEDRLKASQKGGAIAGKKTYEMRTGIHGLSPEERKHIASKAGKKASEMGVGVHALSNEERSRNAMKVVEILRRENRGIFAMTKEQRSETGRKTGLRLKEEGRGVPGLSWERRSEIAKSNQEKGLGIFGLDDESLKKIKRQGGKVGGKVTSKNNLGIHGLPEEEIKKNSIKGIVSQGMTPWILNETDPETGLNEPDLCVHLAQQPEYQIPQGRYSGRPDKGKIADKLNSVFHKGKPERSKKAVEGALQRSRKINKENVLKA
ncbi:hypothetical protein KAR91_68075 [Candidatus Pacearchaeota archaeon]|nr:hypothetical protein [Candidatus Pacearchaeota archaeon]